MDKQSDLSKCRWGANRSDCGPLTWVGHGHDTSGNGTRREWEFAYCEVHIHGFRAAYPQAVVTRLPLEGEDALAAWRRDHIGSTYGRE